MYTIYYYFFFQIQFECHIYQDEKQITPLWQVLQAFVMIASITLVAILGIYRVGGIVAVWDRAVEGGRIFTPMYVFFPFQVD